MVVLPEFLEGPPPPVADPWPKEGRSRPSKRARKAKRKQTLGSRRRNRRRKR